KLLSDELAVAGRALNASDFNVYVFKGLRSDFKDIVTTLSERPEPVSYSELHSLLLNHEFIHGSSMSSLSLASSVTYHTTMANVAQRSFHGDKHNIGQINTNSQRGSGRSYRGRGGRGGRNLFHRNTYSNNYSPMGQPWNSNNDGRVRCRICNGTNHQAATCYQWYNHTINPSAHLSHQEPILLTQNWYPDTGATHHIAPDLSSFTYVEEYKGPDQLHIGNGQGLPI
ncbi:hypothetical protein A4A49_60155, partial [Nicotiana attenuata]